MHGANELGKGELLETLLRHWNALGLVPRLPRIIGVIPVRVARILERGSLRRYIESCNFAFFPARKEFCTSGSASVPIQRIALQQTR